MPRKLVRADQRQSFLPGRYLKGNITKARQLPREGRLQSHGDADTVSVISTVLLTEVLGAIRDRYFEASRRDKSRILGKSAALTGCQRKHAVRLLNQCKSPRTMYQ